MHAPHAHHIMVVVILGTAACATTVTVHRLKPAEVNLARFKKVAVGGVRGEQGADFAGRLTQAMLASGRFEVVDREHLDTILREQRLNLSDLADESAAPEVGKLIGSAALIFGSVGAHRYTETTDSSPGTCYKGKSKYTCTTYIRTGRATVSATFKVVDTSTGRVLAAKTLDCQDGASTSAVDTSPPEIGNAAEMLTGCRRSTVEQFMKVIAPYTVAVEVDLEEDGDLPELAQGNAYAKAGNWSQAITLYEQAISKADGNPEIEPKTRARALYDLGVAYGYSGRFDDGITRIQQAYALHQDAGWMEEIRKIQDFQRDAEKLKEQEGEGTK